MDVVLYCIPSEEIWTRLVCMLSYSSRVWLFETPMDFTLPDFSVCGIASLSMRFFRQEYWSVFPSPGDLPNPGIEPMSLMSPALAGGFFTIWATREDKVAFSSVQSLSHVRLCNPMNCSTPGLPVHHQLLEFTQTHVHQVGDAIQPSHPLLSPLLLPLIPPSIRDFSNESTLRMRWPKYWSFSFSISPPKEIPGLISFRMDWLDLLAIQETQESSPTPQFKSINSSVLSFLYSPTLTSIHDHWKKHSLD